MQFKMLILGLLLHTYICINNVHLLTDMKICSVKGKGNLSTSYLTVFLLLLFIIDMGPSPHNGQFIPWLL